MSKQTPITVALGDVAGGKMHALAVDGREIVICRTKEEFTRSTISALTPMRVSMRAACAAPA